VPREVLDEVHRDGDPGEIDQEEHWFPTLLPAVVRA
jgi:hypothetical protein